MSADLKERPEIAPLAEAATARVLLVDDQAMVGEAIRRAISGDPGLTFRYCADAGQALATVKEFRPTVILQDLVMPNADGLDLVRQYRADPATSAVPIIVLSSKEEPAVKREAFTAGANDYLVKLPDHIELIARIQYHSKAYATQLQRDEAYRALHESQLRLVETNLQLERLTQIDGLTGLSNRRYLNEYLETEWKRAVRGQSPLSVLMVDVDHFKAYNDGYGHLAGDEVLKRVASAIRDTFKRPGDLSARFGGEEFLVVLPETPFRDIEQLGDRLRRSVEALALPHSGSSAGTVVSVSVGGATALPKRGDNLLSLIDTADKALYDAKKAGRNRVAVRDRDAADGGSSRL